MSTMIETLPRWAGWRVRMELGRTMLDGELTRPAGAKGLVVSAATSMEEAAAQREADYLHTRKLATLRFPAPEEDAEGLSRLLFGAALWAADSPETRDLPLGFSSAGPLAASALTAAAVLGPSVKAVAIRSPRPGMAEPVLPRLETPTLFILGGHDAEGIILSRAAYRHIPDEKAMCVVPGATAAFAETLHLQEALELAAAWLLQHLSPED